MFNEKEIIEIVTKLAINELELCGDLPTELNSEDIEDINTLNECNGIQDIELTISDICKRHQAYKTIEELKQEQSDASQKALILHLQTSYKNVDRRHMTTVAHCSSNKNLIQILKNNYFWLPRD